jgi:hypothetical protein
LNVLGYKISGEFEGNQGVLYQILMVLAKMLNFEINLFTWSRAMGTELKHFEDNKIDLIVFSACFPTENKIKSVVSSHHITHPFLSEVEFFVVPPGEEYSGFDKLVLPFDSPTWFLIGLTFFVAFSIIFIVHFLSTKIQDFIFGNNVLSPTFNIAAHFFGLGQIALPRRNFPRFLLTIFILFSLIIRTAYQGKNFEFLQKEMRKPEANSVEEMINRNYKFRMFECDRGWWQQFDKNGCGIPKR